MLKNLDLNNKPKILVILIPLLCCFVLAVPIELICSKLILFIKQGEYYFNFAWYFFIAATLYIIVLLILIKKQYIYKEEWIFACVTFMIGSIMIFSCPFGRPCWDLESHFRFVLGSSPIAQQTTKAEEQIAETSQSTFFKNGYINNKNLMEQLDRDDKNSSENTYNDFCLSHIPGSIMYSTTKFIGVPITWRINLVRLLYLFLYVLICFFAIRKLKTCKMLMCVIAMLPTCVFLASNITYDWWVIGFTILGFSYFLYEMQTPKQALSIKNSIIMSGSFLLVCVIKEPYFLLLFIPAFIRKNNFKKNVKKRILHYVIILISLIILFFFLYYRAVDSINSGGDMRGGAGINASEQINYILSNPIVYAKTLLLHLSNYISITGLNNLTSSFGHLTNTPVMPYAKDFALPLLLLLIATIIDRNKYDLYTGKIYLKIFAIIFFIASAAIICTCFYIIFTPVGADIIAGAQFRYLLPLIVVLLPLMNLRFMSFVKKPKNYNFGFILSVSAVLIWDIATTMLWRLM